MNQEGVASNICQSMAYGFLLSSLFFIFGLRRRYTPHLSPIDFKRYYFPSFWATDGMENKPKTSFILKDKNENKNNSSLIRKRTELISYKKQRMETRFKYTRKK